MSEGKKEILLGDCLELMKDIPDGSIDMILCDLPYNITWCKWDELIPFDKLWEQYERIIKPNGAILLFSTQPFTTKLINSNIKHYKYTWYWVKDNKGNFLNAKRQPLRQLEEINVFYKKQCLYNPQGLKDYNKITKAGATPKITLQNYKKEVFQEKTGYPSNVIYYGLDRDNIHPTQKPIKLFEYLIKTYTNEGELVLDNCAGSGTTAIACLNTNRQFIVMEKEQKYYDIILKRVADFNKKQNNY
jgi:site-specific DNA-methyltransferase (adenine-specific)